VADEPGRGSHALMRLATSRAFGLLFLLPHLCMAGQSGLPGSARTESERPIMTPWPVIELRQYTLLPGKRDVLINVHVGDPERSRSE
jgi:hypothetical protein